MDAVAIILRDAADKYLELLGEYATDDSVFLMLDERARLQGLSIRAEQRGVFGTVITLAPIE